MIPYAALLLALQFAAGCSRPEPSNESATVASPAAPAVTNAGAEVGDEKLVLAFGDSLYAGYGLEPGEGLTAELERALQASGVRARVHNGGVSGDTTAAGLQRLAFTLDGLPRKPDLALVGLGGNDMLRGLDPAVTRKNLAAILAELKRREIPVVLTGMLAAPNMGPDFVGQFNSIYPDLAREYDAALYPFFLDGVVTDASLMLPDRIHPNAAGIDRIVAKLAPVVAEDLGG
jgi:acyl-CoA thioesterase-1